MSAMAGMAGHEHAGGAHYVRRHSATVRVTHWINVLCLTLLLMSGLQIFNAHPALYWGEASDFENPLLAMYAERNSEGEPVGITRVLGHNFETTGVLGLSSVDGRPTQRGFPPWLTIPPYQDLAIGRVWHFFFAWLFVANALLWLAYSLASRHLWRDLVPSRAQLRYIGQSALDHLRLRFPKGEEATRYNVLQKLTYLVVVLILLPLVVLTGLTMSPAMDARFPVLLDLFGGRQSARTIHFVVATLLVLFTLVHVLMVILSGPLNNLRAMITGRYRIEPAEPIR
jgi:thiosulfate reductase cytochrome b subunit